MQPLHFFLGANSEEGFSSLYEQLLGGRFDDLLILKGGAGSGKSTFMRRVGAAVERTGERVVYINCSGDPDSLDGAIFLDRARRHRGRAPRPMCLNQAMPPPASDMST